MQVKFHYQFNLRELSNVMQGMCRMVKEYYSNPVTVARLWIHECERVFLDRMISEKDRLTKCAAPRPDCEGRCTTTDADRDWDRVARTVDQIKSPRHTTATPFYHFYRFDCSIGPLEPTSKLFTHHFVHVLVTSIVLITSGFRNRRCTRAPRPPGPG